MNEPFSNLLPQAPSGIVGAANEDSSSGEIEKSSILRVVAVVACVVGWVWLILTLPTVADIDRTSFIRLVVVLCGISLGAALIAIALAAIVGRRVRARRWGIGALVTGILILITHTSDTAFRGRLWLSDGQLRQFIANPERCPLGRNVDAVDVGLFRFNRVVHSNNGAVYFILGYNFKDAFGFVYLPPGTFPHQNVTQIFGPWYEFNQW